RLGFCATCLREKSRLPRDQRREDAGRFGAAIRYPFQPDHPMEGAAPRRGGRGIRGRCVVPACSLAHRLSCSTAILAVVRQKLHLSSCPSLSGQLSPCSRKDKATYLLPESGAGF